MALPKWCTNGTVWYSVEQIRSRNNLWKLLSWNRRQDNLSLKPFPLFSQEFETEWCLTCTCGCFPRSWSTCQWLLWIWHRCTSPIFQSWSCRRVLSCFCHQLVTVHSCFGICDRTRQAIENKTEKVTKLGLANHCCKLGKVLVGVWKYGFNRYVILSCFGICDKLHLEKRKRVSEWQRNETTNKIDKVGYSLPAFAEVENEMKRKTEKRQTQKDSSMISCQVKHSKRRQKKTSALKINSLLLVSSLTPRGMLSHVAPVTLDKQSLEPFTLFCRPGWRHVCSVGDTSCQIATQWGSTSASSESTSSKNAEANSRWEWNDKLGKNNARETAHKITISFET